ncbi:peptide/nickel transport system ATP-binding protein [Actinomadura meyerae]|uniref:Peptide/nickel transport system ATP-binding protein n=1 Tax=Actinomadura meyerae TaxID=240840 RepID=A0A239P5V9_9ACTN|nr:ABC transporter ATP-binding protein [Actinomadura meyerae]SNT62123.1 peptide/nickel transport system ATP-binding protein [Actinomadura meyerae]
MTTLNVEHLSVAYDTVAGRVDAVRDVSFDVAPGEIVGIVGESGSGKSVTARAILGLVRRPGRVTGGSVHFGDTDLLALPESRLRAVRGRQISMIFQDPRSALNPLFTVGDQLLTVMRAHGNRGGRKRAEELLRDTEIPAAARRLEQYPHELSGGMRQRVMIAMALANEPRLLIADEPTTALDVTVQAQILDLLGRLNEREGMSILFISHSLDVVAELAARVLVFRDGELIESGPCAELFASPQHPYTQALLEAARRTGGAGIGTRTEATANGEAI